CRLPIPKVPCPCKPTCGGPPCIPDCCPGSERGNKGGGGCGCRRKKRSADPAESPDNQKLREKATIDFGSFMDKVGTVPEQDHNCNSERLKAVLQQSISDNTTQSVERILERIDDGQFIAKCTLNGVPTLERRVSFCQLTKGNTTCIVSTGRLLDPPSNEITLSVSDAFRPVVVDGPTPPPLITETIPLPDLFIPSLVSAGPVPPAPLNKRRGEGFVAY
ncbi:hypothetical protein PENTCL1PPCAC_15652, partial [Pristionchus entomophagus]